MSDPRQTGQKQTKQNLYVAIFMAAVLVFGAANAVFITANEYDPMGMVLLDLVLDAGMTVLSAILLVRNISLPEQDGLKTAAVLAGVIGIAAGAIKLGARLVGDHGWWTGHYSYSLG